jgi:hypothetical protein
MSWNAPPPVGRAFSVGAERLHELAVRRLPDQFLHEVVRQLHRTRQLGDRGARLNEHELHHEVHELAFGDSDIGQGSRRHRRHALDRRHRRGELVRA